MSEVAVFRRRFLAQAPLSPTLEAFLSSNSQPFSVAGQDAFACVVSSAILSTTPPSPRYALKILQLYVKRLEQSSSSVESDVLSSALLQSMASTRNTLENDPDLTCYEVYFHPLLSPTASLRVRVAPYHNDVGLRVWEAGYFLAEFLMSHNSFVSGRRVLELGAGCGLTGLVCAGSLGASAVHLTDYTDETIANMRHNVEVNGEYLGPAKDGVTIGHLDWCAFSPSPSSPLPPPLSTYDTIIAADVVYDVDYIPHLVSCLCRLLAPAPSPEGGEKRQALFATTFRNAKTFTLYVRQLEEHGVTYKELSTEGMGGEDGEVFDKFWKQKRNEVRMHRFTL